MEQSLETNNHYIALLYKAIRDRIKDKVKAVSHIDLWSFQTMQEETTNPYNRPAVFVDFKNITPQRQGKKRYQLLIEFELRIVADVIQGTSSREGPNIIKKALSHFMLQDQVLYYMDGFRSEEIGLSSISWTGTQIEPIVMSLAEHICSFKCIIKTDAAMHAVVSATPEEVIIPNII